MNLRVVPDAQAPTIHSGHRAVWQASSVAEALLWAGAYLQARPQWEIQDVTVTMLADDEIYLAVHFDTDTGRLGR